MLGAVPEEEETLVEVEPLVPLESSEMPDDELLVGVLDTPATAPCDVSACSSPSHAAQSPASKQHAAVLHCG